MYMSFSGNKFIVIPNISHCGSARIQWLNLGVIVIINFLSFSSSHLFLVLNFEPTSTGCPKILYPLAHDFISPNGNELRKWNSIHINTNMCSFKMSGERTLKVLRNRSYGQNKLSNPNSKKTQSFWKRDDP